MRIRSRIRLVALLVAGVLTLAADDALASRGRVVNGEAGYATRWVPIEITASESTVRCNLTLEGTFGGTTFAKTSGITVARVLEATLASCTGGTASVLTGTLPWTIAYSSFSGTLPRISEIQVSLSGVGISIEPSGLGISCLLATESRTPARGRALTRAETGGGLEIPTIRADETTRLPLTGLLCPSTATLRGNGVELTGETEIVAVQLI